MDEFPPMNSKLHMSLHISITLNKYLQRFQNNYNSKFQSFFLIRLSSDVKHLTDTFSNT